MDTHVSIQEGSEQGFPHHHLHQTSKKHVATVNSALTHSSVASTSETSIFFFLKHISLWDSHLLEINIIHEGFVCTDV